MTTKPESGKDLPYAPKYIEDYLWEAGHVYIVDVSYRAGNPIHRAILHAGFVKEGKLGAYSQVWCNTYEEPHSVGCCRYLKVISDLGHIECNF